MIKRILHDKYFWFCLGLLVVLVATTIEVARGRNTNYFDYQDSTRMFWEGISPYNLEYAQIHGLYILYIPVFFVLFAPILYLPWWLGPFVWNIGNYCLFTLAIKTLPKPLDGRRLWIFVFLLSVVLQTIFCYQYNIIVAYIYIFAFTLLERGKAFWAVLLIMISAMTKVYGVAELGILLFYPKFWRNIGYTVLCGVVLFLLPALNTAFDNVFALYGQVFDMISAHHSDSDFVGILFARGLKPFLLPNYRLVQLTVFGLLVIAFFLCYKRWGDFKFRVRSLAVLTGFMILFSDCPETHTYVIALPFYAMSFWLQNRRTWIDWTLFWLLVVNFCILPTDVLCPAWLHNYIHQTFWLDVYTFFFCWLRVIWLAIGPEEYSQGGRSEEEAATQSQPTLGKSKEKRGKWKVTVTALLLMLTIGIEAQTPRKPATRTFKYKDITFRMKLVQGGTFKMGALPGDTLADADEFHRQVTLSDYYIGETEVTQELWEAVMGKNRSKQKGPKMPVDYVTYDMCLDFIAEVNRLSGLKFRLPSEAEWEYAARGGKVSKGFLYAGSNDPDKVAHTLGNTPEDTHQPVGLLAPNELGIYDMSGNVWEFCADWYQRLPEVKPSSNFHVIRGGGYENDVRYCRVTNRYMYDQRRRFKYIGFRLAL